VAFRFSPDPDCFFRGDDPLAVVASIPELIDLDISPVGAWPGLMEWDPFRCISVLEGISRAPIEDVRKSLRLVADQVLLAETAPARIEASQDSLSTIRVDAARLDRLADDVGELVVATNRLAHVSKMAAAVDQQIAEELRTLQAAFERVGGRLHQTVSAVRRVSLAPALRRLPRLVRELAENLDKSVRFDITGQAVEVDKAIADQIFEPLLHLVRNAVDHGLETAAERQAAGKPADGMLHLDASIQGDDLLLILSDDGRGIDPDVIREVAVTRGLMDRADADAIDDDSALRLILRPGFSTAAKISEVSGRGVGMDSVNAVVEQLGGSLSIDSRVGQGTTIDLRLPLDAITTKLLIIRSGDERYGVRLDQIVETTRIRIDDIQPVGTGRACVLRERTVPVLELAELLGHRAMSSPLARLLVTEADGHPVAVRVDGLGERIDARVRETGGLLAGLPGVAGTTLMGDGQVLIVLDLPELVA
jgi:two-component system chemotaxis sensor kinase CheA